MSLLRLNTTPTPRDLRLFSALWLLFLAGLGALAWRGDLPGLAVTLWCAGAVGGAAGLLFPPAMRLVYLGSVYAAFPIGFVVSHLALGAVYYLVLTPTGLIMRLLRHDPLERRFEARKKSYWKKRSPSRPAASYFRQH
jgi:hypothetical protein